MNKIIKQDLYRYGGAKGCRKFIKFFLFNPGFRFTFFSEKVNHLYFIELCIVIIL